MLALTLLDADRVGVTVVEADELPLGVGGADGERLAVLEAVGVLVAVLDAVTLPVGVRLGVMLAVGVPVGVPVAVGRLERVVVGLAPADWEGVGVPDGAGDVFSGASHTNSDPISSGSTVFQLHGCGMVDVSAQARMMGLMVAQRGGRENTCNTKRCEVGSAARLRSWDGAVQPQPRATQHITSPWGHVGRRVYR